MAAREVRSPWESYKRQSIQEAVIRLICREGLKSVTMERVAQEVGIAKGTVYLYYKSKDQLLRHALSEGIAGLRTETVPIITGAAPIETRLRQFLTAMIAFVLIAAVVFFLVVKPINALVQRSRTKQPEDPTTKKCAQCLSDIPIAARRCAFCTSDQKVAA